MGYMPNTPEERPNRPSRRPAGEQRNRGGKKPSPAGMQVVLVQSVSCIAVILLVLVMKLVGGDAFAQLRQQFNESIMSNSIVATLAALFESPNSEPVPGDSSGDASQPDGASSSSDTSDASVPDSRPAESGEGASSANAPASSEGTKQAGATLPAESASSGTASVQTVRYAPEGSTFGVVTANRLATAPLDTGTITSGYGYRKNPTKEGEGFHKGLDIGAPEGTPVHAMYFGVVSDVGQDPTYGNYIKLYHGNGIEVLYAHCSEILAEKEAIIRAGEIVAKVGATGDVTGSHLHVEVRVNGQTYNPVGLVPVSLYA